MSAVVRYTAHDRSEIIIRKLYHGHYRLIQQHTFKIQSLNEILQPVGEKIKEEYYFQCALSKMSKMSSVIIENVKYHITTSLKHSYNTIILTESISYQLSKYIVANWATPCRKISYGNHYSNQRCGIKIPSQVHCSSVMSSPCSMVREP